ncbi:26323_t:CDS:2, partial [Racocetra persica]
GIFQALFPLTDLTMNFASQFEQIDQSDSWLSPSREAPPKIPQLARVLQNADIIKDQNAQNDSDNQELLPTELKDYYKKLSPKMKRKYNELSNEGKIGFLEAVKLERERG